MTFLQVIENSNYKVSEGKDKVVSKSNDLDPYPTRIYEEMHAIKAKSEVQEKFEDDIQTKIYLSSNAPKIDKKKEEEFQRNMLDEIGVLSDEMNLDELAER